MTPGKRIKKKSSIRTKLLNLLVALLYIIVYEYVYNYYIKEYWSYDGLTFQDAANVHRLEMYIIAMLPFYFYKGMVNIASSISFFIYLFVYIPFIVTLGIADFSTFVRLEYQWSFMIIMIMFFLSDHLYLYKRLFYRRKRKLDQGVDPNRKRKMSRLISFRKYEIFTWILFIACVGLNIRNISFVNIFTDSQDMYEMRADYAGGSGLLSIYLELWIEHAFMPILFVCYLVEKKRLKSLLAGLTFIILFMIAHQKITLILPFVIWGMTFFATKYRNIFVKQFHTVFMFSISAVCLLCIKFILNPIVYVLSSTIMYRTVCIAGCQLDRYLNFFEMDGNPYTNYGHIGFVNSIFNNYPYPMSIGQMVAGNGSNSNATFLLMDGVAAEGATGCFIVAFVFIIIKSILNNIGIKYDKHYVFIIYLMGVMKILNTSLFTSLFSFGIILIYIILLLVDFKQLKYNNAND